MLKIYLQEADFVDQYQLLRNQEISGFQNSLSVLEGITRDLSIF